MFFIVAVMAAAGCNKKFLEDMKSYDKFDETMFQSEILTGSYIDRMYNYYFGGDNDPRKVLVGSWESNRSGSTEELGGNVYYTDPNKNLNLATQGDTYYATKAPDNVQNEPFTRIRFANFLLEKIDGGSASGLTDAFKKTAKGQMYMFRALQYFDLVRVYGGVPLVLEVQDASIDDPTIKLPRAKSSEIFDQIAKDLDSAAALLPWKWTSAQTDFGRFTAGVAVAMKSRVLLTAASPLFNKNWDNPGDTRWQKALDAGVQAEQLLTANGYGTTVKTAQSWGNMFTAFDNEANANNGEAIFTVLLSNATAGSVGVNNGWENAVRLKDYNGGGGISVPKGMLDLFPMNDGTRPVIGVNYNDTFFFQKRDPRFYRTFAFSGCKWGLKSNASKVAWIYRWKDASNNIGYPGANGGNSTNSPAVVRKGSNVGADSTAFVNSGTDIYDFRYGELLLNIAECYAAKGDVANCVNYLVKIRQRVYPATASANNYGIGTPGSKYAALEACLYERQVELAYEGKRFWDLQRWMLYDDDASIGDNTNSMLGIAKLNGTARQGYYWQFKTAAASSKTDPLTATDKNISIDPDAAAATFQAQCDALQALYQAKFQITPLDKPWDVNGSTPINMLFRSNYYILGLNSALLGANPWLTQTIGWGDYNNVAGTFDYRQ
ncbi:RagB/SusD domain-containing protein [Niastella koreensis GR20-10]|uniref:RagB/SusD domain-containing protein n=1 Tax=Niastella koreensis (strain DSM 17620 / KACC 11465 / NBRC 106392 / GR20-10) TaxID=700598 RepID=G8TNJ2_NIAKG|nr:RagB/SusD domain-containing protein [Niastella koreensis GR20-10]